MKNYYYLCNVNLKLDMMTNDTTLHPFDGRGNAAATKERASNFELLRIICMLFIVLGHVIIAHQDVGEVEYVTSHFVRSFSIVAVNVFVLISGFWGIKFKTERLVKLCSQTWFYSVVSLAIVVLVGFYSINIKKDFLAFLPIFSREYWFITAYFALYCIAPFINHAIENVDKFVYRKGLLVGFLLFYVWPTFCFLFNANQLVMDAGYGIVNFVYLYLLGRYIRYHYNDTRSSRYYMFVYLGSCALLFIFQYVLSRVLGFEFSSWLSYNTVFVLIAAVALFMFFKGVKLHSRIINIIAAPCLAVYLVHMSPYTWRHIVAFLNIEEARGGIYVLMLAGYPFLIYLAGFCVEKIRLLLFGKLENALCKWIKKRDE